MRHHLRNVVTFAIALALMAVAAHAHRGKPHLLGTVVQLHENHLTVNDKDGKEHTVLLTDATKLEKAGKPATRADLGAGVRGGVHLARTEGKAGQRAQT